MAIQKMTTEQVQTSTPLSTDNIIALKRPFKVDAAAVVAFMLGLPFLAHAIQGNLAAGGIGVLCWIIAVLIIKVWHWIQDRRMSH